MYVSKDYAMELEEKSHGLQTVKRWIEGGEVEA
jgi:hypothetical protein